MAPSTSGSRRSEERHTNAPTSSDPTTGEVACRPRRRISIRGQVVCRGRVGLFNYHRARGDGQAGEDENERVNNDNADVGGKDSAALLGRLCCYCVWSEEEG